MKFSEVKIFSFLTLKVIQSPFGLKENLGTITYLLMFIANSKKGNWMLVLRMMYGSICPGIIPSFSCWRRPLKVICGAKHRMPLSKRNCLSPSMTQIISLHIKFEETVPAGSINVFITLPHNFPPGRKLGKQAPSLASTFKNGNRKVNHGSYYIKLLI